MITSNLTAYINSRVVVVTEHSPKARVSEHIPRRLTEAMDEAQYPNNICDRRLASSITKHLFESGQRISTSEAFNLLFKSNKGKLLRFIEALAIKEFNPDVYIIQYTLVAWDITYWFWLFEDKLVISYFNDLLWWLMLLISFVSLYVF